MLGPQPTDAIESRAHVGQEGDRCRFFRGRRISFRLVEGPSDLSVAVAFLPESVSQKLQFSLQSFPGHKVI
jgi:hypothetical protein